MTAKLQRSLMPMFAVAALLLPAIARAGDAEQGITVTGTATVKGKPTEVEINGTVTGEGELANDASVKFRDNKKKVAAAIENLKNADLTMESEGSHIDEQMDAQQQQRIMQGMGAGENSKMRVQISEGIKLKLKNVDKLETPKLFETVLKLIDTCRDSGITIGPAAPQNYYQMQMQAQMGGGNSLVTFKIPDVTDVENQAYKQAIADARTKAQRIADLSGIKLGKVLSVHDQGVSSGPATNNPYTGANMSNNSVDKEATSGTLADIPLTVTLQVQFEIEKQP